MPIETEYLNTFSMVAGVLMENLNKLDLSHLIRIFRFLDAMNNFIIIFLLLVEEHSKYSHTTAITH